MRPDPGFDVNDDPAHQRREWRFQCIGYAVWAVVLATALAGFFGRGPVSRVETASAAGALVAHYERFDRLHSESEIRLVLRRPPVRDGVVRVSASANFHQAVVVDRIQPQPRGVAYAPGAVVFEFPAHGGGEMTLRFRFHPGRVGPQEFVFSLEGGEAVRCRSFVLP